MDGPKWCLSLVNVFKDILVNLPSGRKRLSGLNAHNMLYR